MKTYRREIVICIATALATLAAVWFFFGNIEREKVATQTNLYSLIAPAPDALLAVNRPGTFAKAMLSRQSVYNAFSSEIPTVFLSIIQGQKDLSFILFTFHLQGVVLYAKASNQQVESIDKAVLRPLFNSFAPQTQTKDGITFTFYSDLGSRFFGYYQYNGIWVASYSKKLLEEVARQQTTGQISLSPEIKKIYRKLGRNAPLNILIQADKLNLYVTKGDSTQWRISNKWLSADLFTSEGTICYFGCLPYSGYADTLYTPLADTLSLRLNTRYPHLKFTSQANRDSMQVLFTGCSPM